MTGAGITRARSLPAVLSDARFRRPTDRSNQPVDHFTVSTGFGEDAKITSLGLAQKTSSHLRETGQQPLIIEASPLLLANDIAGGVERAGLSYQLNKCRSIFFCSDLYDQDGRLSSFAPLSTASGQPEIYVNVRTEEGLFLKGLAYFTPLAQPLCWLQALGQTDKKMAVPLLQSLNLTSAIHSLLNNFPGDGLTRGYFLGFLRAAFSDAQEIYQQFVRTQMANGAEGLPPAAVNLYESLSQQPLLQPVEELAGRAQGN